MYLRPNRAAGLPPPRSRPFSFPPAPARLAQDAPDKARPPPAAGAGAQLRCGADALVRDRFQEVYCARSTREPFGIDIGKGTSLLVPITAVERSGFSR